MKTNRLLSFFAAIGPLGWTGLLCSGLSIVATFEEALRSWRDKGRHGRRTAALRLVGLVVGAIIAAYVAGGNGIRAAALWSQLNSTQQAVTAAQSGLDEADEKITKLRAANKDLKIEADNALKTAADNNAQVKKASARISSLITDTQQRTSKSDRLAQRSVTHAIASEQRAARAADIAHGSERAATVAVARANASAQAALAAAVKAKVYVLPEATVAAIRSTLVGLPTTTTAFIACSSGYELPCTQLASAFRSAGMHPTVRPGASFFSGGLDSNPLAPSSNPNITLGYMAKYATQARAIASALGAAGLTVELDKFGPAATAPNIEINFHYAGAAP